jgi:hypothetical protein
MHSPALLLAAPFLLFVAGEAQAHRLNAQAFLHPGNKLQVDAWFSTGESARGAKVEIHGNGDRLIAEGKTNDNGSFVCSLEKLEALRIVVTAGAEHRTELRVSTEGINQTSSDPVPLADRDSGLPWKDILIGIGFLLALAGFALSYRNYRKLRSFEFRLGDAEKSSQR